MSPVNPTADQFQAFTGLPDTGPFVMVNLLKFKKDSTPDGKSGRDAYRRYSHNVLPLLLKVGGKVVWSGNVDQVFIGAKEDEWDFVLLVEYPSKKAFMEMVSAPEYTVVQQDREAGLEKAVLMPCSFSMAP